MTRIRELEYNVAGKTCLGYAAFPDELESPKPCVLIAHDWGGRHQLMCSIAEKISQLGYIGFAIDMYGNATLGQDKEHNRSLMTPFVEDRNKVSQHMTSVVEFVGKLAEVDEQKIGAIGYCFGGLCVLDLARTNADICGVISLHGNLLQPGDSTNTPIKAKVLALHGYLDKLVPPQQMDAFAHEMTERGADWQLHCYGQAHHSFSNPNANDAELGLHYNALADKRSWQSVENFLNELFHSS